MRQSQLATLHLVSHQNLLIAYCQTHTYFSHEEKSVHLLNLDPFPKESLKTEVESIVVTPNVFSSNESLEFFAVIHHVIPSISSFSECLEFFLQFLQILSVLVMLYHERCLMYILLGNLYISLFSIFRSYYRSPRGGVNR